MKTIRTTIGVNGYTQPQVVDGLQALQYEFSQRPWLEHVQVGWNTDEMRLDIVVQSIGTDLRIQGGDVGAVLDEVSDCVLACLSFPAEHVSFAVLDARFVESA